MAEVEQVPNLMIGSGEAGKWMAWELGRARLHVAPKTVEVTLKDGGLRYMVLAHPTMAEGLNVLFRQPFQFVESAQRAQNPIQQLVA